MGLPNLDNQIKCVPFPETNPSPNATTNTVIKRETSRQRPETQEENDQNDLDSRQEVQDSESNESDEDSMFQEERNDQDDEEEQPSSSGSGSAKYSLRVRRKLIN